MSSLPSVAGAILSVAILLGGPALAQQPAGRTARVAWASVHPLAQVESVLQAFRAGLAEHGYVEGRNLEIVARSGDGARQRMPAILNELAAAKPDVIATHAAATFAAREVTGVPVVYGFSGDPIAAGLTDSLARPSRNLTGMTFMSVELNEKRLDLLRQVAPRARTVVLMGDPVHPGAHLEVEASEAMARRLGLDIRWRPTGSVEEALQLIAALDREPPDGLVVLPDSVMLETRREVAEFAIRHRIPAISGWSAFAQSGGLLTYGPRFTDTWRRLGAYVARILGGAKPSDLPVERPTVFELVVNLKTAQAIGLAVPPSLLARADEVIE